MAHAIEVKLFRCSKCNSIWHEAEQAIKCCAPKHCQDCGVKLKPRWYRTVCEPCHLKKLFNNAEKLTPEQWDGWVLTDDIGCNEGYFASVEELIEYCEDTGISVPEWVFCCKAVSHSLNLDSALESMLADAHEDAYDELTHLVELQTAVDEWNAKQTVKTYYPDYKRIVILNKQ